MIDWLKEQLLNNEFSQAAFIAGIMGLIIRYGAVIGNFLLRRFTRLFVYHTFIESDNELYELFSDYLTENYSKKFRSLKYSIAYSKVFNKEKLIVEQHTDNYTLKIGKSRYLVSKTREKLEGARDLLNTHKDVFHIQGLNSKPIIGIIRGLEDQYINRKKESFKPHFYLPVYSHWETFARLSYRSLESIYANANVIDDLKKDLDKFLNSKEWYEERGIPYTRGYLLSGPPGNGKTSLIRALAYYLKRNVYNLSLNSVKKDTDFKALLNRIEEDGILVLEDFDVFFTNEDTREVKEGSVNFSALINGLDGLVSNSGLITIMTTNKPEKLDKALVRDGRMDYKIVLNNPSKEIAKNYINNFFKENTEVDLPNIDLSFSTLQGFCLKSNNSTEAFNKIIKNGNTSNG